MLGRFLFRWRGVIGVLAFGVVFWLARPTFGSCLVGVPFLLVGLAVRFWASGYLGIEGRAREIGGRGEEGGERKEKGGTPRRRIRSGPYHVLRHPLYIGNFLLVVGMLVALRPALWLVAVVVAGFVAEYTLIVVAEERYLAAGQGQKPEVRSQKSEVRIEGQNLQSMVQCPESFLLSRALVEWRTWVVTGAGWGLALLKAFITI